MDGHLKVQVFGQVATLVVKRTDGHTLSLSSRDQTLIHFDGNKVVQDHGFVADAARFASILSDFLAGASVNGYDYKNQAWIVDGVYVRCGHPLRPPCGCYGRRHMGEPVAADADIH